jgi:predicted O-methyltransferase YrrM
MSDQSQPERERLLSHDYDEEVAMYRAGKLAGPPAFDPSPDLAMLERWRAHRTGLAPYYPLLYSLVIGMGAQRVFEFGMGESSAVLLSALEQTHGHLVSCSPDSSISKLLGEGVSVSEMIKAGKNNAWTIWPMLSQEALTKLGPFDIFDLVLHDGSHSAAVVTADLLGIMLRMKDGGLILVHDVLHSYVGEAMRRGVSDALTWREGARIELVSNAMLNLVFKDVTLPGAFGLQIIQVTGTGHGPVSIGPDKPSSPHRTLRWGEAG